MRSLTRTTAAAAGVLAAVVSLVTAPPAAAAEGTLTVRGSGTLVLTRDSDFTLPRSRQRQRVGTVGGNHPYVTVTRLDPPAVTVERGATLHTADRAPRPFPTPSAAAPRSAGAAQQLGFGWWPYALGSALVISLAVPVAARQGRGGRHAGRARR